MDRFIVGSLVCDDGTILFKIQYGQIYRVEIYIAGRKSDMFKIQYGQIYSAGT